MSDNLKIILVGAGPVALAYARVLTAMGRSFCVVGRGPESAAAFLSQTGMAPYRGGLDTFLAENPCDETVAAIVALPVMSLASATISLVQAGVRRILVEKPAAVDVSEAGKVAEAATQAGADVFVAYNRRFYASVFAARSLIDEDGGVTSFSFEFTERSDRVTRPGRDSKLLANWFLANSSHVVDLAFYLGGTPVEIDGSVAGAMPWHPAGAVFAGHGRTKAGALFAWHADWSSAGRWGIDLRTARRRLVLQPLEELKVQEKGSFDIVSVPIDDRLDHSYKPGFYRQVEAFLSSKPKATPLKTAAEQAQSLRDVFANVCGTGTAP